MLEIKDKKIKISWGDTIPLVIKVPGYAFEVGDVAIFAIKESTDPAAVPVFSKRITSFKGDTLAVNLSPKETQLPVGTYYWDLSLTAKNGAHYTLNFPSVFIVEGVVHND